MEELLNQPKLTGVDLIMIIFIFSPSALPMTNKLLSVGSFGLYLARMSSDCLNGDD